MFLQIFKFVYHGLQLVATTMVVLGFGILILLAIVLVLRVFVPFDNSDQKEEGPTPWM